MKVRSLSFECSGTPARWTVIPEFAQAMNAPSLLRIAWVILPRTLLALSPFYNPRKAKEPQKYRSYMAFIEKELTAGKIAMAECAWN